VSICRAENEILVLKAKDIVVGFLTDVDGVYDRPPDQQGATLIPEIVIRSNNEVSPAATKRDGIVYNSVCRLLCHCVQPRSMMCPAELPPNCRYDSVSFTLLMQTDRKFVDVAQAAIRLAKTGVTVYIIRADSADTDLLLQGRAPRSGTRVRCE
jgi:uridylate kinase